MGKIIAIASQKGGVGKSTTCRNMASMLSKMNYKVLAVDCDTQASLSNCFGIDNPEELETTLYHLMMDVISEKSLPQKQEYMIKKEDIDLIPSSLELSAIGIPLATAMSREYVLKVIVDELKADYDYILLDCMPSLGLMTLNVLAACNSVLIPVTSEYLSIKGLELLLQTIFKLKKRINPSIEIEGILLTMIEKRTNLSKHVIDMIKQSYGEYIHIYDTKIPKSVKVGEANLDRKGIVDYAPNNSVAIAYQEFTKELIKAENTVNMNQNNSI